MSPTRISRNDIGSTEYQELLRQEADFWERSARGEMDISVATWRNAELATATSGDLLARALDLAVENGPHVLELACADGALGMRLARRGCLTDGVDISLGLIQQGQHQIEQLRPAEGWPGNVRLFVSDLNRLALAPNTYDVVFAAAALHHVIDLDYLTKELYKTLKPGGMLICLDHMEGTLAGQAAAICLPVCLAH